LPGIGAVTVPGAGAAGRTAGRVVDALEHPGVPIERDVDAIACAGDHDLSQTAVHDDVELFDRGARDRGDVRGRHAGQAMDGIVDRRVRAVGGRGECHGERLPARLELHDAHVPASLQRPSVSHGDGSCR
jgi:hypothetical protein